jgi:LuxR family maltose regulon positive regulatory protein
MRQGTPSPILITKIEAPRLSTGLLDRPRLLALLPLVRARRLTLIKGAAGFGKTSVGAAWAVRLLDSADSHVAWLSLDQDDDVPTRFLYYVGHALQRAYGSVGTSVIDMIGEISLVPMETALTSLINELAELDDDVFLFLDDYQSITDARIHEGIAFLLRHASSNFHLVLISRTDPQLPLATLLALNQLLEVDASLLRFDLTETRRFLEREKMGQLDAGDVTMLHSTTDGWPAALRLVVSMHRGGQVEPYLRSMQGVTRPIETYIEDMLATLPPDLALFMMQTSILDRFNAPLCDAVTGATSSRESLNSIGKRQLLMTSLGGDEYWYHYHPLLVDFLRHRIAAKRSDELPELHRRAAKWFASQELWTDAVRHALAAGDTTEAASWIENCAMVMVKRGELLTLLAWQRQLPDRVMRSQMGVRLAIAWGLALAMRFDESLALIADIEGDLAATPTTAEADIRNECQTIRSVDLGLQDNSTAALALATPCVQGRGGDPWNINVASNVLRFGFWKSGNLEAFYAAPWLPYSAEDDSRNVLSHIYRLCFQGLVELQQLRLDIAERHFVEALHRGEEAVGPQSTCAALPSALIGQIRYEQGRLDDAEGMIGDRLPTINATTMLECVLPAYLVLARIAASRSNLERAYTLLEQATSLGYTRHWGRLVAAMQVERLKLYIGEGRLTEASACVVQLDRLVAEYPAPLRCAWSEIENYRQLARAHIALAKHNSTEAVTLLRVLRDESIVPQRTYFSVRLESLLCIALLDAGEQAQAMQTFRNVLTVAASAGIYRTIIDSGPKIGTMLRQLHETPGRSGSDPPRPYLEHLLVGWRARYEPESAQIQGIADPLTPREHGILELIANGRSNKEVAKSLGIAPETVKYHVKNIFTKLSVDKRTQAITRAQSLGLLRTGIG